MGSFIPYFGGKNRLAKTIISKFPDHGCYVEVFAGGAHVLFRKEPSHAEVLNDLDRDLVTLYRVIKHHPEELHRQFKYSLISRDEFRREREVNPDTLTDIQRAARYLYLQKTAFGGKSVGQTFGTATTHAPRLNFLALESTLEAAWERLARVTIECMDYKELIKRYDRPHTLFFLDPPYYEIPGYKHNFVEQDFLDLANQLATIKGRFLMTINDHPEVRQIFKRFTIEEATLKYSVTTTQNGRAKTRTELIITN
ncbi:MAG: DNA adenine methylase [Desulfobulbaceae bacterium]|nr:DNA adenine methylase [Desulfobulbaceae bacterium]